MPPELAVGAPAAVSDDTVQRVTEPGHRRQRSRIQAYVIAGRHDGRYRARTIDAVAVTST